MKNSLLYLVGGALVLIILVGGYLGRREIKSLLGLGTSPAPAATNYTNSTPSTPTPPSSPAVAPSNNIYLTRTDQTKGDYLADFKGMTLYIFDKDTAGTSTCYNACAALWPAYTSGAAAQTDLPPNITVVARTDGSSQFAWKGMPLYYYAKDQNPGDLLGDGIGGIWHIVKP